MGHPSKGSIEPIGAGETLPAIPPEDYKGTQADWMVGLQQRGLWDGEGWMGDVEITREQWWELLEECEKGN